jgi:hypothetical protein
MTASIGISVTALIVSLVSAIAGWGRWRVTHHQIRTQNLLQVSSYLHEADYRDARHKVRTSPRDQLEMDSVRKVCSSFDFAALFVKNKLISEDLFIQYWRPLLLFLDTHLSGMQRQPAFGDITMGEYYQHFWWLLSRAREYYPKIGDN